MRSTRMTVLAGMAMVASAAGCNTVTTGHEGVLTFTPDECGESGCSLDDDLVVGGSIHVSLDDAQNRGGGSDLSELTLISSDESVFRVELVERGSFTSEWRVRGVGPGWAELIAIDEFGYEIDHTELDVRMPDRLAMVHRFGSAVGPTTRLGYDQVWTVNADAPVELAVAPFRNGTRLTGKVGYQVDIDNVLLAGVATGSDLEEGELEFRVPLGEYDVTYIGPTGATLRVLIVAQ